MFGFAICGSSQILHIEVFVFDIARTENRGLESFGERSVKEFRRLDS
jgi:hypothetical protein